MGLVNCIPVLGAMVSYGYLFDDYEKLLKEGRPAPTEFKIFDKFGEYLQRGVMPFLAVLLVGIGAWFLSMLCMVPFFILSGILAKGSEEASMVFMILGQLVSGLLNGVLNFIALPIAFRVGLSNRFEEITNVNWSFSMVKAMWLPMLIAAILSWFIAMIGLTAGFLLCCVGIIPAGALIQCFYFQIQRQIYEIYITKGGEPIPLQVETIGK